MYIIYTTYNRSMYIIYTIYNRSIYRVSQEECEILRESVP